MAFAATVNLTWEPSPDAIAPGKIANYKIYYGLQDFTGQGTNATTASLLVPADQTSIAVSNVVPGTTYYFAVVSVDAGGLESDYSNLTSHTVPDGGIILPPIPPDPTTTGIGTSTGTSTGTTAGTTTGSSSGSTTGVPPPSTPTQASLIGMLPRVWLYPTNGQALLAIAGTVGATFAIQSSTNPASPISWNTITNLKLTAAAPGANLQPGTTLEKAFVPALESFQDPTPLDGAIRYYRIYMPLGYAILANQALTQQGYVTRLVAVRMPGLNGYIVCHVTEEAAYLDYNNETHIVKLEESGPTIREIATRVSTELSQNWTSASEFTVTDDGAKLLFATVVQTDDPSTDPPLGVPRTASETIIIDF